MTPEHILYEKPEPGIARIVLNRPQTANAQDTQFLYELNDAFDRAARDDAVKVIILAASGPHFSSGHDLREGGSIGEQMAPFQPVGTWCGFGCAGAEGRMAREREIYLGLSERWRNPDAARSFPLPATPSGLPRTPGTPPRILEEGSARAAGRWRATAET